MTIREWQTKRLSASRQESYWWRPSIRFEAHDGDLTRRSARAITGRARSISLTEARVRSWIRVAPSVRVALVRPGDRSAADPGKPRGCHRIRDDRHRADGPAGRARLERRPPTA